MSFLRIAAFFSLSIFWVVWVWIRLNVWKQKIKIDENSTDFSDVNKFLYFAIWNKCQNIFVVYEQRARLNYMVVSIFLKVERFSSRPLPKITIQRIQRSVCLCVNWSQTLKYACIVHRKINKLFDCRNHWTIYMWNNAPIQFIFILLVKLSYFPTFQSITIRILQTTNCVVYGMCSLLTI